MPLRDDLLNPIPGANPAGADLRYEPVYDKLKEARREEEDLPQGDWQHARKTADYAQVIQVGSDTIATKSKDLQIGVWLTEALLKREGYGGLRAGIGLLRDLVDRFWDNLYPELEDGDAELRAAPLEWLGTKLDIALRQVPLDRSGHDFLAYKESRVVPTESEASSAPAKKQARDTALAEGKLTPEEWEKGFDATPKAWYKQLAADVDGSLSALTSLDALAREKFGDDAPTFRRLQESLEEVQRATRQILARKLELEPDPPELVEPAPSDEPGASPGSAAAAATAPRQGFAPEPVDRDDAAARVVSAARYLRRTEPRSPTSYLMLRGLRWGELRAQGSHPDPRLLDAPTTHVRTQLRSLTLDAEWEKLLEAAESVMATPAGRGWLDLQRYALTALQGLGSDYEYVATAIRRDLRALLADIPGLIGMTMMDDMPVANGATMEWLREEQIIGQGEDLPVAVPLAERSNGNGDHGSDGGGRGVMDRAAAEVRGGRPERAVEMLMRELDREKSRRGRFVRQAQLAAIMVDAGLVTIARPILEELMAQVEAHRLEDWEAGDLVAQPIALLYRCIEKMDNDAGLKQQLYLRICRLDPLQAISFSQQ